MGLFSLVDRLSHALDGSSLRHKLLSNNLANANTPGYKRSDVDFQSTLDSRLPNQLPLARTKTSHYSANKRTNGFVIQQDNATTMRNDGNNVDIEKEMTMVLENQLYYQTVADSLNRRLGLLRSVIGEGRR